MCGCIPYPSLGYINHFLITGNTVRCPRVPNITDPPEKQHKPHINPDRCGHLNFAPFIFSGFDFPYTFTTSQFNSVCQETYPCTGGAGDEKVLCLPDKLQGGRPFHLVPGKPAAYCVVYLFRIGLVTERGHAYESLYGRFRAVVPFAGKQSGEEVAQSGRFGKGWREAFGEGHGHAVELHAVHLKDGEHFLIPVKTDLGGTRAQRNRPCKP